MLPFCATLIGYKHAHDRLHALQEVRRDVNFIPAQASSADDIGANFGPVRAPSLARPPCMLMNMLERVVVFSIACATLAGVENPPPCLVTWPSMRVCVCINRTALLVGALFRTYAEGKAKQQCIFECAHVSYNHNKRRTANSPYSCSTNKANMPQKVRRAHYRPSKKFGAASAHHVRPRCSYRSKYF